MLRPFLRSTFQGLKIYECLRFSNTHSQAINDYNFKLNSYMDQVTNLDYNRGVGQVTLIISTNSKNHKLKGFEVLLKEHLWKVIESDFKESELFFRDQPYQKLVMSQENDTVKLKLIYPDSNDLKDAKMEVSKSKFKNFLEELNSSLSD